LHQQDNFPNKPIFTKQTHSRRYSLSRPRILLLVQRPHRRCDLDFGMAGGIEALESLRRPLRPSLHRGLVAGELKVGCNGIGEGDYAPVERRT
jgi:hypothetical protein